MKQKNWLIQQLILDQFLCFLLTCLCIMRIIKSDCFTSGVGSSVEVYLPFM